MTRGLVVVPPSTIRADLQMVHSMFSEIEFDRRSLFEYRAFRIGALHGEITRSTSRSSRQNTGNPP